MASSRDKKRRDRARSRLRKCIGFLGACLCALVGVLMITGAEQPQEPSYLEQFGCDGATSSVSELLDELPSEARQYVQNGELGGENVVETTRRDSGEIEEVAQRELERERNDPAYNLVFASYVDLMHQVWATVVTCTDHVEVQVIKQVATTECEVRTYELTS